MTDSLAQRKDALIKAAWIRKAYQTRRQALWCALVHRWRWWGAIDGLNHCYRCGAFVKYESVPPEESE